MDLPKQLQCLLDQTQIVWRAYISSVISTKEESLHVCD